MKNNRTPILTKLKAYKGSDANEESMRLQLIEFVETHEDCFERTQLAGHVNGSAWIIDKDREFALLTHHAKLNKWLQLGGHSDGDPDTLNVATREANEESGLKSVVAVSPEIFDIDIHPIPARGDEPEHFHYDIRFMFYADKDEPFVISEESKDLAWVKLDKISELTDSESMLRMVRKSNNFGK